MIASIEHPSGNFKVDLANPIDISLPLEKGEGKISAWYVGPMRIEPVKTKDWVGDVNAGGSVNFRNIYFNPHGHGTHTECVGHISKEWISINRQLTRFFFKAQLISIKPEKMNDDYVITKSQVERVLTDPVCDALIIRTLPNDLLKQTKNYSNTNPPYLHYDAAIYIREKGILHLLIDLPSIDREQDEGRLLAHHAFWNYPKQARMSATITELIFVADDVNDGTYLLNLQIASFENDASPSKPVLYKIIS